MLTAIVYSKSDCGYCVKAKNLLKLKGIEYAEYIISAGIDEDTLQPHQHYVTVEQLKERVPAAKTVPQIWLVDNGFESYIGGYTELAAFFG